MPRTRCCPFAIVARSKADEDKLSAALSRLVYEDPTMRLEINPETHQPRALVHWARRHRGRAASTGWSSR